MSIKKNPGDQLTICKVKERKPTARNYESQKQLTNFPHNIETIGPNVNSKKQQKQKNKKIYIINNIYIIHSCWKNHRFS